MTPLPPDCLVFKLGNGEDIPCSVDDVAVELIGEAVEGLDPAVIRNASAAVLYYFKNELGRTSVSVGEFSLALERALRCLGLEVKSTEAPASPPPLAEADLAQLAGESGAAFELTFFVRLRDEMRHRLKQSPRVLYFCGLRGCVKQLAGARRWSGRCQELHDHIVDYMRGCLTAEASGNPCALVVH